MTWHFYDSKDSDGLELFFSSAKLMSGLISKNGYSWLAPALTESQCITA